MSHLEYSFFTGNNLTNSFEALMGKFVCLQMDQSHENWISK